MRACLCLVLAGCTDAIVTGAASSTAHPAARSAHARVGNVSLLDPPGTYRRWDVYVTEDAVGTPCEAVGAPVVAFSIYTLFDSAPRGAIPLSRAQDAPIVFPAAYGTVVDGINVEGTLSITAAATTKVLGSLDGLATIDGTLRELDVTFEAPTCGP